MTNLKLGFLLSHIGDEEGGISRLFLEKANSFLDDHLDVDIIAFITNQVKPPLYPRFALMNINEAYDFDGIVIATDLFTAEKSLILPRPSKRFYYMWNLDWNGRTFEELISFYNSPKITFIPRRPEDKEIFEKCWNRQVEEPIADCDVEEIIEMIRKNVKN